MSHRYSAEEAALLSRYVTDLEGDVYCIYNLPEEVVAVLFAYVSRSPLSFRDNLLKLLRSDQLDLRGLPGMGDVTPAPAGDVEAASQRARQFHERYTVGYGHASVAEHAVVKVGIERISRFASALLETANPFLSFTEYSQRYQRPAPRAYHVPAVLEEDPGARALYQAFQDRCFRVYEEILTRLHAHLLASAPREEGEPEKARSRRLEKLAFEDARYALTLATHTNLGMTGNARAVRDTLVVLFSEPWDEVRLLAQRIKTQVQRLVPTLLRYADPNPYRRGALERQEALARELAGEESRRRESRDGEESESGSLVRLLGWSGPVDRTSYGGPDGGNGCAADEEAALDGFLWAAASQGGRLEADSLEALRAWPLERKRRWAQALLEGLGPHDNPHDATRSIRYRAEFIISEANWHQFLRHSRKVHFVAEPPGLQRGITIPPRIEEAGLAGLLRELDQRAHEVWDRLVGHFPQVAPYLVLNAHRRRVVADFDLWELYHLVNLRTSPEAQWDIRQSILSLYQQVARIHPTLVAWAMRRAPADGQAAAR